MCGNRVQIGLQPLDVYWNLAGGLDSIGMEVHAGFFRDGADFLDRLNRSNLIVGVHDRNQNRVGPDGAPHVAGIDNAVARNRQPRNLPTLLLEILTRVKNGMVFDPGTNDVPALGFLRLGNAANRKIIRFRAATDEEHLRRACVQG